MARSLANEHKQKKPVRRKKLIADPSADAPNRAARSKTGRSGAGRPGTGTVWGGVENKLGEFGNSGLDKAKKLNKHQVRSRATQNALLDAAEKVFFRDGFELAQIDVIAAEAGRTRGAVYAHYESKAELFLSVLRRRIARTDEFGEGFLAREAARGASEREAFQNYYVALHEPAWAVLLMEFKLYALRRPAEMTKLREMYRELMGPSTEERRQLMGEDLRGLDVETRFSAMMSFVSAVVLDMHFDPEFTDLERARGLLRGVFDSLVPGK